MAIKHNRHSIEAAQRCRKLGDYVARDTANAESMPLDLTAETRRLLDDFVLPSALMQEVADYETMLGDLLGGYEALLSLRRMGVELKEGESYFDRLEAERALITAVGYFARLVNKNTHAPFKATSKTYWPENALTVIGADSMLLFRTVSRWDDYRRAILDYPAILTWLAGDDRDVRNITIQPVVVGSVGKDGCYEMPLTRRYVDGATGQYWWSSTKLDAAGNRKRLGRSWRKEVLSVAETEEWCDYIAERAEGSEEWGGAVRAVFPDAITFIPAPIMINAAEKFHDSLNTYPVKESRGCLFPNKCPFIAKCWGVE